MNSVHRKTKKRKKINAEVTATYHNDAVVINKIYNEKMDVIVLTYSEFEELAYKIRASPYGF